MTHEPLAASPSAPYHHGDLRSALIAAARNALVDTPPEAISLRSLATELGVSQPAPYRHFKSREALMQEVAADGFSRLGAALSDSLALDHQHRLMAGCLAYVDLAFGNMGVYRLMFSGTMLGTTTGPSALALASDRSYQMLVGLVASQTASADASRTAILVWAALHGIVTLEAEGVLSGAAGHAMGATGLVTDLLERLGLAYSSTQI